jgi:hypothetical protein
MLEKLIILYAIGFIFSMIIHVISWNILYKFDKLAKAILDTDTFTQIYELIRVSLMWFITIPDEVSYLYGCLRKVKIQKQWEKEANQEVGKVLTEKEIDDLLNNIGKQNQLDINKERI